MKPEEQRIAIAIACGYSDVGWVRDQICGYLPGDEEYYEVPNYLTDLNAMHEAEKILTPQQEVFYKLKLSLITHRQGGDRNLFATAPQRAEAFCRVKHPERFEP